MKRFPWVGQTYWEARYLWLQNSASIRAIRGGSDIAARRSGRHGNEHQMMLYPVQGSCTMRTTIAIDDELFAKAQEYAGVTEKSAVVREALKAFVQREAARRLARLGGTEPDAKAPPRRRSKR
jgi:Arc/MetJ family transcription regulator